MQSFEHVACLREKDKALAIMPIFHGFGLNVCIHTVQYFGGTSILLPQFNAKTFDEQSDSYKANVLNSKNIVAVEAGAKEGLAKYVCNVEGIIGISEFGESGSKEKLFEKFKITKDQIIDKMKLVIKLNKKEK